MATLPTNITVVDRTTDVIVREAREHCWERTVSMLGWRVGFTVTIDLRPLTWVLRCAFFFWHGKRVLRDYIPTLVNRRFAVLSLDVGPVSASITLIRRLKMPSFDDVYQAALRRALV